MTNEYMLTMKFSGVSPEVMLENHGQAIHTEYMRLFGGVGVATIFVKATAGPWDYLVYYTGTAESSEWLEGAIHDAAHEEEGGSAVTSTAQVEADITSFFDGEDSSPSR